MPAGPTVLTAWTGTLVRALEDRGIDALELAAAAGIAPKMMADPDRRVPLDLTTRLWALAVEATGDPALGLDVARYVRPGTFHALGLAVLASPTLGDALERIARYSQVIADVAGATVSTTAADVELRIEWRNATERPSIESIDAIFSTIVRSTRFMLDRSVSPAALSLERPRPATSEVFDRVFRCPITYSSRNSITYDADVADLPIVGGNATLASLNDEVVAHYIASLGTDSAVRRAREALLDLLPGGDPTISVVASCLNLSARTLQRELNAEGSGFRDILADVRRELAEGYLRGGRYSVTEIAYLLGYHETAAFSRSFKTWNGVSPSRWH